MKKNILAALRIPSVGMFNAKNSNIFLKGYSLLRNTECRFHTHFFTPSHLVHQQVPLASRFSGQLYSMTTFSYESSNLSLSRSH